MAIFQEQLGVNEPNLPSVLEETRVLDKHLGRYADYTCFVCKRLQENRGSIEKVILALKNRLFGLWFYDFCREFADSMALGGHFSPLPP